MSVFIMFVMLLWAGVANAFTVTASNFQSPNKPENAIDGDINTRWSCLGECWIQLDLGYVAGDNDLYIVWRNIEKHVPIFEIEISLDGETWEVVNDGTPNEDQFFPPHVLYSFDPGEGYQYIRVTGHGNSFNGWNSILEMTVNDPPDENWARREIASISASHHEKTNAPELAFDGNLATHWTADSPAWLEVELIPLYDFKLTEVDQVKIAWKSGNKRVAKFDIEASMDGVRWEVVYSGESTGKSLALESYVIGRFGSVCARYVRIVGKGNNDPKQAVKNSITEAQIWGMDSPDIPFCDFPTPDSLDAVTGRM